MKDMQQAADDLGTICDAIAELGSLLDKFHSRHGDELYADIRNAWPLECEFGAGAPPKLIALLLEMMS